MTRRTILTKIEIEIILIHLHAHLVHTLQKLVVVLLTL